MEDNTVNMNEAVNNGDSDGGGGGDTSLTLPTSEPEPIRKNVRAISPPPFLTILYNMVDDPNTDSMISWSPNGDSFIIYDSIKLAAGIFPKFFRHDNISSFIYQLNNYGFRKISWERPEYFHKYFLAGQRELLKSIKRRDQNKVAPPKNVPPVINSDDLTNLKKDQSKLKQLMQSAVQKQKALEEDLTGFKSRIEDSISKQEKMLTLLVESLTPSFLSQLKEKMGENSEDLDGEAMNKRQKLSVGGSTDDAVEVEAIEVEDNRLVAIDEMLHESGNVEAQMEITKHAKLEMVFENEGWNWASIKSILDHETSAGCSNIAPS